MDVAIQSYYYFVVAVKINKISNKKYHEIFSKTRSQVKCEMK